MSEFDEKRLSEAWDQLNNELGEFLDSAERVGQALATRIVADASNQTAGQQTLEGDLARAYGTHLAERVVADLVEKEQETEQDATQD